MKSCMASKEMAESSPILDQQSRETPFSFRCKNLILIIASTLLLFVIIIFSILYSVNRNNADNEISFENLIQAPVQRDQCKISLVESIPVNLTYPTGSPQHLSTYHCWKNLLNSATKFVDIASFYWALRGNDTGKEEPTAAEGENIFNTLLSAGTKRNISIRIVQNIPSSVSPNVDTKILQEAGAAVVRTLNMTRLLGAGIIHTKMWLIDGTHFYVGSANLDWRSLTQVKELGVVVYNCTKLANDMQKIFEAYWLMADSDAKVPKKWPKALATTFNAANPMSVAFNNTLQSEVYLSSSPPPFCPSGRTSDVNSVLSVIDSAEAYVHIAVMDYAPMLLYSYPRKYWSIIDDKLRKVAFNKKVHVKLLISQWNHTIPITIEFLKSLAILNSSFTSVQVKLFKVPCVSPAQCQIPFARVNHNKYMVTDKTAYIGTSNWSGDYFVNTGGIGFILSAGKNETDSEVRQQLADVFLRDWNSKYAEYLLTTNSTDV